MGVDIKIIAIIKRIRAYRAILIDQCGKVIKNLLLLSQLKMKKIILEK